MGDYYTVKVKRKIIEDARKANPRRTDMLIETYCTSDMDFDELMDGLRSIAEDDDDAN